MTDHTIGTHEEWQVARDELAKLMQAKASVAAPGIDDDQTTGFACAEVAYDSSVLKFENSVRGMECGRQAKLN